MRRLGRYVGDNRRAAGRRPATEAPNQQGPAQTGLARGWRRARACRAGSAAVATGPCPPGCQARPWPLLPPLGSGLRSIDRSVGTKEVGDVTTTAPHVTVSARFDVGRGEAVGGVVFTLGGLQQALRGCQLRGPGEDELAGCLQLGRRCHWIGARCDGGMQFCSVANRGQTGRRDLPPR